MNLVIRSLLLLLLLSSCIHDPPCEQFSKEENVRLLPQWTDFTDRPPQVFVQCYLQPVGATIQNFIPSSGGSIYLPGGEYNLLLYSNISPSINFRKMDTYESAEAYVEPNVQPDRLYCGSVPGVKIRETDVERQIEVPMVNVVRAYPFTYRGVTGLQYVNGVSVSVDGINLAVQMSNRTPVLPTYKVNCPYQLTADGFEGVLRCFGHGEDDTKHSFTVRFEYGGRTLTKVYDVTDMLNLQGRIDLYEALVFEPLGQGDIQTGVGDWGDDTVDIPIN